MAQSGRIKLLVTALITLGLILPIVLYAWLLGRVPTLTAQEALALLHNSDQEVVLIDVRETEAFRHRHVAGAQNWPFQALTAISTPSQMPAQFRGKTLLLICENGFLSARAVRSLQLLGLDNVYNVRGGLQAWVAAWARPCSTSFCWFQTASEAREALSFRALPGYEQWAAVIAAFGIKPFYMLLSLALVLILWPLKARDLTVLKWAFIFFFVGEAFCALNYLFLHEDSYLFEYLHSYGMVVAFGFTIYAFMAGLDSRVFRLSNPGKQCVGLELCNSCIKYEDVPCGARRLFLLLTALFGLLTVIPLLAVPNYVSYNTDIFGTPYNYSHPVILQLFELRYCPIVALILLGLAFIDLWLQKDRPTSVKAKIFFAAGLGTLSFSLLRLGLNAIYRDDLVWSTFWEESTELLYVVAIGYVLWIFRRRLFQENMPAFPRRLWAINWRGNDRTNP